MKNMNMSVFLLFVIIASVIGSMSVGADGIITLDNANFEEHLKTHKITIAQFYFESDNLSQRRNIGEILSDLSTILDNIGIHLSFVKITYDQKTESENPPNIVIFKNEEAKYLFEGEVTTTQIYGWIKDCVAYLGHPFPGYIEKEVYFLIHGLTEKIDL